MVSIINPSIQKPLVPDKAFHASESSKQAESGETLQLNPALARVQKASRCVLYTAGVLQSFYTEQRYSFRVAMLTLTYSPHVEWRRNHISALTSHVSKWAKRRTFTVAYLWVMELHKSGLPHYHVLFWLPRGHTLPMPDKQGWWPHGHTNITWARKPVPYIAKYASKLRSSVGSFPKNARIYGCGGLPSKVRDQLTWLKAPAWLRQYVPSDHIVKRETEGWWLDKTSGIRYRTPYIADWNPMAGCVHLRYVGFSYEDVQLPK